MTEKKLLNIAKEDIKLNGSFCIPKNHPDNDLTKAQVKQFQKEIECARKLVKKKILKIVADDRRILGLELA